MPSIETATMTESANESSPLRAVLVSRFPKDPNKPRGGVETATIGLARALRDFANVEVHILTVEEKVSDVVREEIENISIHRLPRSSSPMFIDVLGGPSIKRLNQYLKKIDPDVVHYHETWGFASQSCGYPAVFTVHGFDSLNLPTSRPRFWRLRSAIWKVSEKIGIGRQKNIISIAPYVKREVEKRTSARIFEIWNPLTKANFELNHDPQPSKIIFLGWLNSRKNPIGLVEAIAPLQNDFPELTVDICGEPSDPKYYKLLQSTIAKHGLEEKVSLLGRQTQSEVRERLRRSELMVLPSFQENAPMVVAESMACGVPVVASNLCGMPDMIQNEETGILVDPTNREQLTNAIRTILENAEKRVAISQSAKALAFERFHPKSVATNTRRAYQEVIDTYQREQE